MSNIRIEQIGSNSNALREYLNPYLINIFTIQYFWLYINSRDIFDRNNED